MEVTMQKSRRNFLKNSAVVAGATVMTATTVAVTKSEAAEESGSHGVVLGQSPKKEILYKKTAAWDEYYKQAL